ncbi:mechanosensitive ion channel family protein [Paracrocinitomix mangrovi]|uniref:mechanosensitive ion channel family protein n=1 Tax=Paracrocinitomix mangrovi TaxID=2862509 RepID=UPI001C8CFFCA|nr:mechanosensitive ion channel family protein [Paracrocinitomix mangrovi]UKN00274.1 mechanosensitive ion channel family protein [Paracrocinitomix mangrovi]
MQLDLRTWIILGSIFLGAIITTRTLRWLISRSYKAASAKIKVDPTRYKFTKNALSMIIWMIALGAMASYIPELKALAVTLFAGAGILVAVAGFAAQQAFSNVVGGIFIVMFRPFRVGDLIKVGTRDYGIVEDITLRHTVILNFENKRIIIPNSVISEETIINDSIEDDNVVKFVEVGISYDSDLKKAVSILQEVAMAHPDCLDNRTAKEKKQGVPQVVVRVYEFDDFSINLRAFVWCKDPLQVWKMHSDINIKLKERFDEEGIEIPFPYRTIVFKDGEKKKFNKQTTKT